MLTDISCWLRTALFYLLWFLVGIPLCTFIIFAVHITPESKRHSVLVNAFCKTTIYLCKMICGIRWHVEGLENIPETACVVASNHQSGWETFFLQILISPQATVLKKELLHIPFFGWALARMNPIAIDRKDRRSAMLQVKEKGKQALETNYSVMIFPEGTRHKHPQVGRFGHGVAALATYADQPILPIVHNAGQCWPSFTLKKTPGLITVRVGPVISSQGKEIEQITAEVREWIVNNHP